MSLFSASVIKPLSRHRCILCGVIECSIFVRLWDRGKVRGYLQPDRCTKNLHITLQQRSCLQLSHIVLCSLSENPD